MPLRIKRAYEPPKGTDGHRILVDRFWPRGLTREKLRLDSWMREVAPSKELCKWFGHDPAKWAEFKMRYFKELQAHGEQLEELRKMSRSGTVTLVFAAQDGEHNNAAALKKHLEGI